MKPQNQVTVRSSETGDVFRINRKVAERHDTLAILDDTEERNEIGGLVEYDPANVDPEWVVTPIPSAKPVDPIAAPVADDN